MPVPAAAAETERHRLLLVDDDPVLLLALCRVMRGYPEIAVRTASDHDGAMVVIAEWPPDAILTDVDLGDGPDGFELAIALMHTGVVIALASGLVNEERRARAAALGAVAIYEKPFDLRDVVARLFAF